MTWNGNNLGVLTSPTTATNGTTSLYVLSNASAGTGNIVVNFQAQTATGKALTASSVTNLRATSALDDSAAATGSSQQGTGASVPVRIIAIVRYKHCGDAFDVSHERVRLRRRFLSGFAFHSCGLLLSSTHSTRLKSTRGDGSNGRRGAFGSPARRAAFVVPGIGSTRPRGLMTFQRRFHSGAGLSG